VGNLCEGEPLSLEVGLGKVDQFPRETVGFSRVFHFVVCFAPGYIEL